MFKSNSVADIEIHGVTVPKGSLVGFDSYPIGMDPQIVDQPEKFIPERWIGDEPMQARKGTPAEVLDSIMYRDPFSQGVRAHLIPLVVHFYFVFTHKRTSIFPSSSGKY
jgi:cytochrome P450